MIELIFYYITGAMVVSSVMMWWFNTNLPIHIVQILYKLGFRKDDPTFWLSDTPVALWSKLDFDNWKLRTLPAWLDEVTSCPGCLSMHISFWTALFISLLTFNDKSLILFFLAWGGWPYISNLALAKLKELQKH